MPQPMQGPPTSRGTLQRGPNGFVVKSSAPAPAAPKSSGALNVAMNVQPDAIVAGLQELGMVAQQSAQIIAQAAAQSAQITVQVETPALLQVLQGIGQMFAQSVQALAKASQSSADLIASEIEQLRASIDAIRPTVNVAAPEVNVAAPQVTVKAPDVNVPQANISVVAEVKLPPPREKKVSITVDENGNAEGTVS